MTIYQVNLNKYLGEIPLENLLKQLPSSLHERARRYRSAKDAYAFVLGRLLLKRGLKELNLVSELEQIQINENGKPFLNDCFFNISHSKDLVICGISKNVELGIDLESINEVDLSLFETWFTKTEWEMIHQSKNSLNKFYDFWTRKESIIKALGLKLSDLNRLPIEVFENSFVLENQKWYLQELDFGKKYKGCLCCNSEVSIKWAEI